MPVFNERWTIEKTIVECCDAVCARFDEWEIIVVDDASSDGTDTELARLAARIPRLQVLGNSINRGHGPTLQRGLSVASGDLVFVIDSDYQHRPADFWRLYAEWNPETIVMGFRQVRKDGWFRLLISRVGNLGILVGGRKRVNDINIPFKLFPRDAMAKLLGSLPQDSLVPSTLLIIGAIKRGFSITEIPVEHLPRERGQSSLAGLRFLGFGCRAALEIIRYKIRL